MSFIRYSCYFGITVLILSIYATNASKAKFDSRVIMGYNWPQELNKGIKRFPHQVSCYHFFLTRPDGRHTIKKCPRGKRFDFSSLKCSHRKSAKCWSEHIKRRYLKKTAKDMVCPYSWGFYPDIDDCSKFFSCVGGTPYHRKCRHSTLFDKALRQCVKENEAMCADSSDIVEPGFECPYKWGLFAHSKDCSKFHMCLRKKASVKSCRKNMLFDNMRRECFPKEEVDCGQKYNPYALENLSTKIELDSSKMSSTPVDMHLFARTKKRSRHPGFKDVTTKQSAVINNVEVKILDSLMSTKGTIINASTDDISKSSKIYDGTDNVDKQSYDPTVDGRSSTKYMTNMKPEELLEADTTIEKEDEEASQPITIDDLSDSKGDFSFTGENIQNTSSLHIEPVKKYLSKLANRALIYSINDTKNQRLSESVPINHLSSNLTEDFQFAGEHMRSTSNQLTGFTTKGFDKSNHLNATKRKSFVYVPKVECFTVIENQEKSQPSKEAFDELPSITPYHGSKSDETSGPIIDRPAKEADMSHPYQTLNGRKPMTYVPIRSFKLPFRNEFQSSTGFENEISNQPTDEFVHMSDSTADVKQITYDAYTNSTAKDFHKPNDHSTLDSEPSTTYTPKRPSSKQFGKEVRCRVRYVKKILNKETDNVAYSSSGLLSTGEGNTSVPFTTKNVNSHSAVTKESLVPEVLKQKFDRTLDNDFRQSTSFEKDKASKISERRIIDLLTDAATNVLLEHEQATSDLVADPIAKKK